ncbi:hypothetical protein E2C01_005783 [Portunus trituberculatus]|uniref:Uncharacterized protein n=1 Tax=Portunus trituberculatus TaxID=210409 RepID=A0A5B7CVA4_PORTR|nr:hypothetical protein [Portunus trituberculatus]
MEENHILLKKLHYTSSEITRNVLTSVANITPADTVAQTCFTGQPTTNSPQQTMGMSEHTLRTSLCQLGTFLYVTLEVTSKKMKAALASV